MVSGGHVVVSGGGHGVVSSVSAFSDFLADID